MEESYRGKKITVTAERITPPGTQLNLHRIHLFIDGKRIESAAHSDFEHKNFQGDDEAIKYALESAHRIIDKHSKAESYWRVSIPSSNSVGAGTLKIFETRKEAEEYLKEQKATETGVIEQIDELGK